ncbi:phosphatase PAP2 family protein [Streptomyces sp. NPDC060205]|uniref:phosphatase PAP2 family protein n=1 Tax=Streptomyces sp. NPDC060205 TaxID=3347072 RepID=UPI0036600D37
MVVVGHDGTPLSPDSALLAWSAGHRPDMAVAFARGLTATGTGAIAYLLAVLAGVIAGRTLRQRTLAVALCLAYLGIGQSLRYGVMSLVARPRPPLTDWQTHASGWSFPSGHTTTAALTAGLLIIAVRMRAPRGGTPLVVAVGVWGALVGLTRVYLGVHWFTDVVGGWLFALGWLGVCLCVVARVRFRQPAPVMTGPAPQRRTTAATGAAQTRTDTARERTDPGHERKEHRAPDDPGRGGRSRSA